ncbi:MAG: TetR/AcrR family transcriptional regulator [Paludibacteraceae bacterium]|nr:TetR/AcrR family transcriptional regulator [Paludibacteraceae bacterium]
MKTSKEEIVQAATKLFIRKGYHGVNLTDIEGAVGITRGGLFYHIDSKEHIYKESLNRYLILVDEIEAKFNALTAESLTSFIDQYISLLDKTATNLGKLLEPASYFGYFSFFLLAADEQPELVKKFDKINADQIKLWNNIIAKAAENGEIAKDADVESLALLFRNATFGMFYNNSVNSKGLQTKQLKKTIGALYDLIKK